MTRDEYLRAVAYALRDLRWRAKRDLLADLRGHLAELPPETDLVAKLGTPEQYTAELRAAAGLHQRRGVVAFLQRFRLRRHILVAVGLIVLGLGIGTLAWIHNYQPLRFGGGTYEPGIHQSPAYGDSYYVFRQGKPWKYGITVWNSGRFTVRVVGVPIDYGFRYIMDYRVRMSGPTTYLAGGMPLPVTAFHPFDLKPGEMRVIYLIGSYGHCRAWKGQDGSQGGLNAFPIRYRFLWDTRTANIPLPQPFDFVFKRKISCVG